MTRIPLGFELETLSVPLASLLPSKKLPPALTESRKFQQIRSSIKEIGLIEPLSVTAKIPKTSDRLLLDGHIRVAALSELGVSEAPCLEAKDDEGYTYNSRVNRLSTIQEHYMIRRAVERGVSPERLATVLSLDVSHIAKKMRLLDGICAEAQQLLKDRQFSPELSRFLRRMKPMRQVECVELMLSANNLSVGYAQAILVATPEEFLVEGKKPLKAAGVTQEQMLKMQREMTGIQSRYKLVEETYGQDVLNLVLARGFLVRLLGNSAIVRYLKQTQPDVLREFESIATMATLEQV